MRSRLVGGGRAWLWLSLMSEGAALLRCRIRDDAIDFPAFVAFG
jgi:hypothetical protein